MRPKQAFTRARGYLAGGDSDVLRLLSQGVALELLKIIKHDKLSWLSSTSDPPILETHRDNPQGPASALSGELKGQGNVNDDLLVRGSLEASLPDNVQVGSANIANVTRNVQEAKCGDLRKGQTHWSCFRPMH